MKGIVHQAKIEATAGFTFLHQKVDWIFFLLLLRIAQ